MERREALKKGVFGTILAAMNPKQEIINNVRSRSRVIDLYANLQTNLIPGKLMSFSRLGVGQFLDLDYSVPESRPEDDFYVTTTKLDDFYFLNGEEV